MYDGDCDSYGSDGDDFDTDKEYILMMIIHGYVSEQTKITGMS